MTPDRIAVHLQPQQQDMIRGLDVEPSVVGCAEGIAYRLSRPGARRPVLVIAHGRGRFSLNPLGVLVKAELAVPDAE